MPTHTPRLAEAPISVDTHRHASSKKKCRDKLYIGHYIDILYTSRCQIALHHHRPQCRICQHEPTQANTGQHGPTRANMGQHRPTRVKTGQWPWLSTSYVALRLRETSLSIEHSLLVCAKHVVGELFLELLRPPLIFYPSIFVRRRST